jgi:hypothetical protein
MDNPETLATLGTQDQGRRQTQHKNTTTTFERIGPTFERKQSYA